MVTNHQESFGNKNFLLYLGIWGIGDPKSLLKYLMKKCISSVLRVLLSWQQVILQNRT